MKKDLGKMRVKQRNFEKKEMRQTIERLIDLKLGIERNI